MSDTMDISASGLVAQRLRMNVIANNLANANTTRSAFGELIPYRRKDALFAAAPARGGDPLQGVTVPLIADDDSPFRVEKNPGHPDADPETGMVTLPNVDPLMEMVDMIDATRAYEANVTAFEATKSMSAASLRLLA